MKRIIVISLVYTFFYLPQLNGQGCVAIRGNGCGGNLNAFNLTQGEFNFQMGYRFFKSFRHFRGDHQETNRIADGTEVVNHSHFIDFSIQYGLNDRFFLNAVLPFVKHSRSSMYEHGGNPPNGLGERHSTFSKGIGDIRFGLGYWLFAPADRDYNVSLGLGVKLPTGKYDYTDTFYNQGDNRDETRTAVVDQSIQPGDGGTGITLESTGYYQLSHRFSLNASVFYLLNPREDNNVLTRNGRSYFSCPDQYAFQLGTSYATMSGLSFYLGTRMEGVPSKDIIGSNAGYRRPGHALSIEPGLAYAKNKLSIFASVPLAVYRNRTRSYEDVERTLQTGNFRHGDAAFADYLVNVGISLRVGQKSEEIKVKDNPF